MTSKKRCLSILCFYVFLSALMIGLTILGSHTVTVISQSVFPTPGGYIIIDAGHGGIDGGASSADGQTESEINLAIAKRLDMLLQLMGYQTRMVRTTDRSMHTEGNTIRTQKISDLKERVRIVNEEAALLLLSIHQNFFHDPRYTGAQVFHNNTQAGREVAQQLQSLLTATVNPGSNRKCKEANGIYIMDHVNCPAILIECGFLSNAGEAVRLQDAAYQKALCCVIASTTSNYLDPGTTS